MSDDVNKVYEYLLASVNYVFDGYVPYNICPSANEKKLSLCKYILCKNTSGGTKVYQDNGQTSVIESRFESWLEAYPSHKAQIPQDVLINLLHILSKKYDNHGEVAFTTSEKDWYDLDESYEEVRCFAVNELDKMGNPHFNISAFDWVLSADE